MSNNGVRVGVGRVGVNANWNRMQMFLGRVVPVIYPPHLPLQRQHPSFFHHTGREDGQVRRMRTSAASRQPDDVTTVNLRHVWEKTVSNEWG